MIKRVSARDFQGIREASIKLAMYTFLFGLNEAGKTSIAQAIEFVLAPEEKPDARRFRTNPEVVRQGAKKAEIEVVIDDTAFGRDQARAGASVRSVNKIPLGTGEFASAVSSKLGVSGDILAAALRSGSILDRSPQALLDMLMAICGGSIGAEVIARELASVAENMGRLKFAMPTTLAESTAASLSAIESRKRAKSEAKRLAGDLARAPQVPDELKDDCYRMDALAIDDDRQELRQRREAAVTAKGRAAGRGEEKAAQLREDIAKLEAVPKAEAVDVAAKEGRLSLERNEAMHLEIELKQVRGALAEVHIGAAGDATIRDGADELPARMRKAREGHEKAKDNESVARADLKRIDSLLAAVKGAKEKVCNQCGTTITEGHIKTLEATRETNAGAVAKAKAKTTEAAAEEESVRKLVGEVYEARKRQDFTAKIPGLEKRVAEIEQKIADTTARIETLVGEVSGARQAREDAKRYAASQASLVTLRAALETALQPVPEAEDIAPIDARLRRLDEIEGALKNVGQAEDIRAAIEGWNRVERDADTVAEACGPTGAQARIVAKAVQPFLAVANEALARLCDGYTVDMVSEDGPRLVARKAGVTLDINALSDGRRTSLLFVLQMAVAKLAHAPLIVFDRVELMDKGSRKLLGKLGEECAAAGIQVLALSSEAAPATAPAGFAMYEVIEGQARAIPQAG